MSAEPDLRVISYGGGTQSSVLMLLAARGIVTPMPDIAVWADTGNEPQAVHEMVAWMADQVPFALVTVSALRPIDRAHRDSTDTRGNFIGSPIPTHTIDRRLAGPDSLGMSRRFCTDKWKIRPINDVIRAHLGIPAGKTLRGHSVEMWMGISRDEVQRMRDAHQVWRTNRYPLVEDVAMTRHDCQVWWQRNAPAAAPPLPRSACVICPFHSAAEWQRLADTDTELVVQAAANEQSHNDKQRHLGHGHIEHYLHPRRIPLLDAIAADRQAADAAPSMFDIECDGICGT